jgi:hypothetical protein
MTETLKGSLGEFPNTAKGMCELTAAAFAHFEDRLDTDQRMVGTPEQWLLKFGREFDFRPRPEWLPRGVPNLCFANAFSLAASTEGREKGLHYTEGYVRDPDCPINIHHAWCVDLDGIVTDPTLPEEHWDEKTITYFGASVPIDPLIELFEGEHGIGCLIDNVWGRELIEDHHGKDA